MCDSVSEKMDMREERGDDLPLGRQLPVDDSLVGDGSSKRPRDDERPLGIPFVGTAARTPYTRGVPPAHRFQLRKLDAVAAREQLPTEKDWVEYPFDEGMALREASDMTIVEWASMGFWKKNQFGLLFALSARVPELSVCAFWCDKSSEMALVLQMENKKIVEVAAGVSKTKAKQAVSEKMIETAHLWEWLNLHHSKTPASDHLTAARSN